MLRSMPTRRMPPLLQPNYAHGTQSCPSHLSLALRGRPMPAHARLGDGSVAGGSGRALFFLASGPPPSSGRPRRGVAAGLRPSPPRAEADDVPAIAKRTAVDPQRRNQWLVPSAARVVPPA